MRPGVALGSGLLAVTLAGCSAHRAGGVGLAHEPVAPAMAIGSVGVEPKTLDLNAKGTAVIRYELFRPASVFVDLVDEEGRVVRTLTRGQQSKGRRSVVWDGHADDGALVPSGAYRYVIHAQNRGGGEAVHDPSPVTGGEKIDPRDFAFDAQTGMVRWIMPRAGYVRLHVGIQGFPYLRTLADWEPLEAGPQSIAWDGLDSSGLINVKTHPQLAVTLTAFALPDNTIIVRGGTGQAAASPRDVTYAANRKPDTAYLHARHLRTLCHEAGLSLAFPEGTRYDAKGRPVLRGTVPVQVTLNPHDAPTWINSRFEVALYEDLVFLFEDEDGMTPFTFLWETGRLTPGEHLLTVNLFSYDDHYGVLTQPAVIEGAS